MNLQFVQDPLSVGMGFDSVYPCRLLAQPSFSKNA
jgi:hypothetical protein